MRRSIILGIGVVVALLVGGCARGDSTTSRPPSGDTTISAASRATGQVHGAYPSALDDSSFKGVSLEEGLGVASPAIKLPDGDLVGKPVKVIVFPPEETERDRTGLLIAYAKGVRLQVLPGRTSAEALDVIAQVASAPDNYTDSSPRPRVIDVNGHDAFARGAGEQVLVSQGPIPVNNVVAWMDGDTLYSLQTESGSEITLDQLVKAAESVR